MLNEKCLLGSDAVDDCSEGFEQDRNIEPEAPILDIVQIELAPLVKEVADALGLPRDGSVDWQLDLEERLEVDVPDPGDVAAVGVAVVQRSEDPVGAALLEERSDGGVEPRGVLHQDQAEPPAVSNISSRPPNAPPALHSPTTSTAKSRKSVTRC